MQIFTAVIYIVLLIKQVYTARRVDAGVRARAFMERYNSPTGKRTFGNKPPSIEQVLHLTKTENVVQQAQDTIINGHKKIRFFESYEGIKVYDTVVTADLDDLIDVSGSIFEDIEKDIPSLEARITEEEAIEIAIKDAGYESKSDKISNQRVREKIIYVKDGVAHLCYYISFLVDNGMKKPSRPIYFIDVQDGSVINKLPGLDTARVSGVGGNIKTGDIYYGKDNQNFLNLRVEGSKCVYEDENVRVVNLEQKSNTSMNNVYIARCPENDVGSPDSINGGKSAVNDAFFYGDIVKKMYIEWYGLDVLGGKLTLKVHYKSQFENAFWDGDAMFFGDGASEFYPLVSLDITAHEVSHGFTEKNSGLEYRNQSGGINEAFSDMAGEAAEYFMTGANDWQVGFDVYKSPKESMRYMYNPPLDWHSIDHADDFILSMDVHYSSGVYNKAFYNLANTDGWNTKKAFEVFVKANDMYWSATTNFVQGLCGVLQAAVDHGYSTENILSAFQKVGVVPDSSCIYGSGTSQVSSGVTVLTNDETKEGLRGNKDTKMYFKITVPPGTSVLKMISEGDNGDLDLYVARDSKPTTSVYDKRSVFYGSDEFVEFLKPTQGEYYVMLYANDAFTDVSFTASYQ